MASEVDLGSGAPRRAARPAGDTPATSSRGGGNPFSAFWRFVNESIAELKKVEWPGQNQVIQGTVVVLVACVIVGTYLYVNDQIWKQVVEKVLLR